MLDLTPGQTVTLAGLAGLFAPYMSRVLAVIFRGQLAVRKATLEELRAGQTVLDSAYQRLESENKRLNGEIKDLRDEFDSECRRHNKTRRRCEQMEEILRMMGKRIPETPE